MSWQILVEHSSSNCMKNCSVSLTVSCGETYMAKIIGTLLQLSAEIATKSALSTICNAEHSK